MAVHWTRCGSGEGLSTIARRILKDAGMASPTNSQVNTLMRQLAVNNRIELTTPMFVGSLLGWDDVDLPAIVVTPPPVIVPPTPGLFRPFAPNSVWYTPWADGPTFDFAPLHTFNGQPLKWWENNNAAAIYVAKTTDPEWRWDVLAVNDPPMNRNRPALVRTIRAPANIVAGGDSDKILWIQQPAGDYCETWLADVNPSARTILAHRATFVNNDNSNGGYATGDAINGPGAGTKGNNDGCTAANMSWAGGLLDAARVKAKDYGALACAMPEQLLDAQSKTFLYPATTYDNGYAYGKIKMGTRLVIPKNVPKPAGLSEIADYVWECAQRFGIFVRDFCGGNWPVLYWNRAAALADDGWLDAGSGKYGSMSFVIAAMRVLGYQP